MRKTSTSVHLFYLAIIGVLSIVIGVIGLRSLWEKTATIGGKDGANSFTLRMLGSGDLIFEKQRFLPLASYRDYWGDMSVSGVRWISERQLVVAMADGTQLKITLGEIERVVPDRHSPSPSSKQPTDR